MDTHHSGELVNYLQSSEVDAVELAKLEWNLAPLLTGFSPIRPVTLHKQISTDARFFVSLLELIFKPASDTSTERGELEPAAKRKAEYAWRVLDSWKGLPGMQDDGSIDVDVLRDWIRLAREQAKEKDRTKMCDIQIGEMLAHSPPGADNVWPSLPICQILEELDNAQVERGLFSEKLNQRGVVTKNLSEGGQQERNLAKQYSDWAEVRQADWISAPRVLRRLAESYEFEAKREDDEAGSSS